MAMDTVALVGHRNGALSVVVCVDGEWKLSSELRIHETAVLRIESCIGCDFFASCTGTGEVALWESNSFRCLRSVRLNGRPTAFAIAASQPEAVMAGLANGLLTHITLTTSEVVAQFPNEARAIVASVSPEGANNTWWIAEGMNLHRLASSTTTRGAPQWDQQTVLLECAMECLAVSCCQTMLLLYGGGTVHMWDMLSLQPLRSIPVQRVSPHSRVAPVTKISVKPLISLACSNGEWIQVVDEHPNIPPSTLLHTARLRDSEEHQSQIEMFIRSQESLNDESLHLLMQLLFRSRDTTVQLEQDTRRLLYQAERFTQVQLQRQRLEFEKRLEEVKERKMDVIRMLERKCGQNRENSESPPRRHPPIATVHPSQVVDSSSPRPDAALRQEMRKLQEKLNTALRQNQSLQNECERLQGVQNALLQSRENEHALHLQLRQAQHAVQELETTISEQQSAVTVSIPEANTQALVAKLHADLEKSERLRHEAEMKYVASQGELQTQSAFLKGRIHQMNMELHSLQNSIAAPAETDKEMEIHALKAELAALTERLRHATTNKPKGEEEHEAIALLRQHLESEKAERVQISLKNGELEQKLLLLNQQLTDAKAMHLSAVEEYQRIRHQVDGREASEKSLRKDLEDAHVTLKAKDTEIAQLTSSLHLMREEYRTNQAQESVQWNELDTKLRALKSRHETLQTSHRKKERENAALSQLCERQTGDLNVLSQQLERLQSHLKAVKAASLQKPRNDSFRCDQQLLFFEEESSRLQIMLEAFMPIGSLVWVKLLQPYRVVLRSVHGDRERLQQLTAQLSGDIDKHKLIIEQMQLEHNKIVAEFHAEEFRRRDAFLGQIAAQTHFSSSPTRKHSSTLHPLPVRDQSPTAIVTSRRSTSGPHHVAFAENEGVLLDRSNGPLVVGSSRPRGPTRNTPSLPMNARSDPIQFAPTPHTAVTPVGVHHHLNQSVSISTNAVTPRYMQLWSANTPPSRATGPTDLSQF
jgi:hypothetical protein